MICPKRQSLAQTHCFGPSNYFDRAAVFVWPERRQRLTNRQASQRRICACNDGAGRRRCVDKEAAVIAGTGPPDGLDVSGGGYPEQGLALRMLRSLQFRASKACNTTVDFMSRGRYTGHRHVHHPHQRREDLSRLPAPGAPP